MKVYKTGSFKVSKIEFCCSRMAESVLLHKISTNTWTDHPLVFFYNDLILYYCPYCGKKIEGGCIE
jgi:hypothetical protein